MKNLLTIIRQQIIKNELFGKEQKFTFDSNYYPEKLITMFTKQKAFKVKNVKSYYIGDKRMYTIHYSDAYTGCTLLETAYEALKAKEEHKQRKGYYSNEPVSTKFLHINDEFRDELQCKNYNKEIYEYLDKADSCTFALFINSLGFDTYEDYRLYIEKYPNEELDIDEKYREFLATKENRAYAENYLY